VSAEREQVTPKILEELFSEYDEVSHAIGTATAHKVLLDGSTIAEFIGEDPKNPDQAIVETFSLGYVVVHKSRLQVLA